MTNQAWEKSWEKGEVHTSTDTNLPFITFNKKAVVLDIGCGNGTLLSNLKERYNIEPVGIDIVGFQKTKHLFVKADAEHLPFKENTFDIIYGLGSIEHCNQTNQAIKEAYRTLKSTGQALFTVPNKLSLHTLIERPLRQIAGYWDIGLEQSFSTQQLQNLFQKSGFKDIQYKLNMWNTENQNIFTKSYMRFDNALAFFCSTWGFFLCMYGKKK